MRKINLLKGDLRFQQKYGIWFVYLVFILLYITVIRVLQENYRNMIGVLFIYTDPAAMGLFFMGAVVLLEKSQRINCSIAVSPVTLPEYIISKACSFMLAGMIAALAITLGGGLHMTSMSFISVMISSILFSLCGLWVACKTDSLNQFAILSVPFEIVICIPAIVYAVGYFKSPFWICNPGVAAIRLMLPGNEYPIACLLSIIVWTLFMYGLCLKGVIKMFRKMGGGSL